MTQGEPLAPYTVAEGVTLCNEWAKYHKLSAQGAGTFESANAFERLAEEYLRLAATLAEMEGLRQDEERLLRFAGLVLKAHRNDGEPGDVDGGELQDFAIRTGMLESVRVERPCADDCHCAGYYDPDEFPTDCIRPSELGKRAIDAARGSPPPALQKEGKPMQYFRCRCGESAAYGSMGPNPCDFCEKCGSDLAQSPELHRTPQPHQWVTQPVDVDGGQAVLTRCAWCGVKRSKWETDGSPMSPDTAYGLAPPAPGEPPQESR